MSNQEQLKDLYNSEGYKCMRACTDKAMSGFSLSLLSVPLFYSGNFVLAVISLVVGPVSALYLKGPCVDKCPPLSVEHQQTFELLGKQWLEYSDWDSPNN